MDQSLEDTANAVSSAFDMLVMRFGQDSELSTEDKRALLTAAVHTVLANRLGLLVAAIREK